MGVFISSGGRPSGPVARRSRLDDSPATLDRVCGPIRDTWLKLAGTHWALPCGLAFMAEEVVERVLILRWDHRVSYIPRDADEPPASAGWMDEALRGLSTARRGAFIPEMRALAQRLVEPYLAFHRNGLVSVSAALRLVADGFDVLVLGTVQTTAKVSSVTKKPQAESLGDRTYRVGKKTIPPLTERQDTVLQVLVKEQKAVDLPTLREKSGYADAHKVLKEIVTKHPALRKHIKLPGKKGMGGFITDIVASQTA